jgi:hypothetical protein
MVSVAASKGPRVHAAAATAAQDEMKFLRFTKGVLLS